MPDSESCAALAAAFESGFRVFDHADIYGQGECEARFGRWIQAENIPREKICVITKCGHRFPWNGETFPHHYDLSPDWVTQSVERSLGRLKCEWIDLLLMHRPDPLLSPHALGEALARLKERGLVREFGVSNFSPFQIAAFQSALPGRLVAHQFEFHLGAIGPLYDGALDTCLAEKMRPMAWSPLGRGRFALENQAPDDDLAAELQTVAKEMNAPASAVALAWIMMHPTRPMPVIGTVRPSRIREAARGIEVKDVLSRISWFRLLIAAQQKPMP